MFVPVEWMESRILLSAITPSSSVLVFNDDMTSGQPSHTDTLTITNNSATTLTFPNSGGFVVVLDTHAAGDQSADFHITNGSLPTSLAPGASAQITMNFTASVANTIESAVLQINSSDPAGPTTVQLHGLGTSGSFGYNEPSLANILTAFDIPTNIGVTDPSNSQYPETPAASSQEVPLETMKKAGSGEVSIQMLASFNASAAPSVIFGTYTPGQPSSTNQLFTINNADDQTVNPVPVVNPPSTSTTYSFDPGSAAFGLYATFPGISATDTHYSETALNTALDSAHPQKFRFFPMENPNGSAVSNAYVVAAEDYNGTQYNSFTNFVAIISNVEPATATNPTTSFGGRTVGTYTDASGHKVTLRLTGPGTGATTFDQGSGNPPSVTLSGTTAASGFTITAAGGTTAVGSISDSGSLARITAPTTQLQGDLQIGGSVNTVRFAGASGGHTLSIGAGRVASLNLGQVSDLSINSSAAIGTLQASSWSSTSGPAPTIAAPSIGHLLDRGDFTADVSAGTITSINVAGTITGAQIRATGNITSLTAAALVNSDVFAGVDSTLNALPSTAAAFVASSKINSVTMTGRGQTYAVQNSNVAAASLGRITFGAVNTNNGGVQFGLAAHDLASFSRRIDGKLITWTRARSTSLLTPEGDLVVRLL